MALRSPLTPENLPLTENLFTIPPRSPILKPSKAGARRKEDADVKIKIEIDDSLEEDEVLIRCRSLNDEIAGIQKAVSGAAHASRKFVFYKGNTEYYLALNDILFFETDGGGINAHTKSDIYQTKYKLYELEEFLPGNFMRISKSAIVNTSHIYSISRNLTASSVVAFAGTHKQVYVSRYYYKPLIDKLEEKRLKQ